MKPHISPPNYRLAVGWNEVEVTSWSPILYDPVFCGTIHNDTLLIASDASTCDRMQVMRPSYMQLTQPFVCAWTFVEESQQQVVDHHKAIRHLRLQLSRPVYSWRRSPVRHAWRHPLRMAWFSNCVGVTRWCGLYGRRFCSRQMFVAHNLILSSGISLYQPTVVVTPSPDLGGQLADYKLTRALALATRLCYSKIALPRTLRTQRWTINNRHAERQTILILRRQ